MGGLLAFSRAVDRMNQFFGKIADWTVLLSCAISAGNAFVRYGISYSSNAWLEVQWYLFAATVMLGASYTLFRNEHVRVDLVYGNLGERARLWVDVFGFIFFMLPAVILLTWMTWPFFVDSFIRGEGSPNAGGLLRWPIKLVVPAGFVMLALQGVSEVIKRAAALRGEVTIDAKYERPTQ
jgi:TRAP-type mannitol/chloroaromatic compound transport system permease small subunit